MEHENFLTLINVLIEQDVQGIIRYLSEHDFDPVAFKNCILTHELLDTFYTFESRLDLKKYFPDTFQNELRTAFIRQLGRNETLALEMSRLNDIFHGIHCNIIFLKGMLLTERFYPSSLRRRRINDIDILVQEHDITAVDALLIAKGYTRLGPLIRGKKFRRLAAHHFRYKMDAVVVKVHWCLDTHFSYRINYDRLWQDQCRVHFRDSDYSVLSNEYSLVAQILSIFSDIQCGFVKGKSFIDIFMMLAVVSKDLEWDEFFRHREQEGLRVLSLNVLDVVISSFGWQRAFPDLSKFLSNNAPQLSLTNTTAKKTLLARSHFGIRKKQWAFRLYNSNAIFSSCWWFLTFPFRIAMNRHDFNRRLRIALRAWLSSNILLKHLLVTSFELVGAIKCFCYLLCTPRYGVLMRCDDSLKIFKTFVNFYGSSKKDFFFIQIGSCDGVKDDPIHEYIQKYRWSGILIEPVNYLFKKLLKNYAYSSNLIFENVAISDSMGYKDFFYIEETSHLIPEWYDEIGSLHRNWVLKHRDSFPTIEKYISKTIVATVPIEDIIRKHKVAEIDLLHIDAEGHDYVILQTINFKEHSPRMILYEHSKLSRKDQLLCRTLLYKNGYHLLTMRRDTFAYQNLSIRYRIKICFYYVSRFFTSL